MDLSCMQADVITYSSQGVQLSPSTPASSLRHSLLKVVKSASVFPSIVDGSVNHVIAVRRVVRSASYYRSCSPAGQISTYTALLSLSSFRAPSKLRQSSNLPHSASSSRLSWNHQLDARLVTVMDSRLESLFTTNSPVMVARALHTVKL